MARDAHSEVDEGRRNFLKGGAVAAVATGTPVVASTITEFIAAAQTAIPESGLLGLINLAGSTAADDYLCPALLPAPKSLAGSRLHRYNTPVEYVLGQAQRLNNLIPALEQLLPLCGGISTTQLFDQLKKEVEGVVGSRTGYNIPYELKRPFEAIANLRRFADAQKISSAAGLLTTLRDKSQTVLGHDTALLSGLTEEQLSFLLPDNLYALRKLRPIPFKDPKDSPLFQWYDEIETAESCRANHGFYDLSEADQETLNEHMLAAVRRGESGLEVGNRAAKMLDAGKRFDARYFSVPKDRLDQLHSEVMAPRREVAAIRAAKQRQRRAEARVPYLASHDFTVRKSASTMLGSQELQCYRVLPAGNDRDEVLLQKLRWMLQPHAPINETAPVFQIKALYKGGPIMVKTNDPSAIAILESHLQSTETSRGR